MNSHKTIKTTYNYHNKIPRLIKTAYLRLQANLVRILQKETAINLKEIK